MDVSSIPSVDELRKWMEVPIRSRELAMKLAAAAQSVQSALGGVWTSGPVGVFVRDDGMDAALLPDVHSADPNTDMALVKAALADVISVAGDPLSTEQWETGTWIKVASSPWLRKLFEWGNYFPGTYPGGLPNHSGVLTGMLTSGLLGAGLGYGTGALVEGLLPKSWKRGRLRKTLGLVGGLTGVAPGLILGSANLASNRNFFDDSALQGRSGRISTASDALDVSDAEEIIGDERRREAVRWVGTKIAAHRAAWVKEAFDSIGDPIALTHEAQRSPLAVDVDAMGRTLWATGTSPAVSGATMGALGAAQQMPGGSSPGWVTPAQMGNLAARMGAGYLSGALVGAALGALTGLPADTQLTLARTGMYAGLARALVPRLFGN